MSQLWSNTSWGNDIGCRAGNGSSRLSSDTTPDGVLHTALPTTPSHRLPAGVQRQSEPIHTHNHTYHSVPVNTASRTLLCFKQVIACGNCS